MLDKELNFNFLWPKLVHKLSRLMMLSGQKNIMNIPGKNTRNAQRKKDKK